MTDPEDSTTRGDWPRSGQEFGPSSFGPFGAPELARYAVASGDDNPLHLDETVAKAAGLDAPPVHGMLMMSYFEPAIANWRPDVTIARISAKFLRPILTGQSISVSGRVVRSVPAEPPELIVRLMARGADGNLAILAEATLLSTSAIAAS